MAKIALIRCDKYETRCPLTGCLQSLKICSEGFSTHTETELMGVFTCQCPGDNVVEMANILKIKGAEVIHFCTCTFAFKDGAKWILDDVFCDQVNLLMHRISRDTGITCIKGTAHLPEGYCPEVFECLKIQQEGTWPLNREHGFN
jgi:predicted metal-binding protein